jgi:hypothetical protein
MDLDVFLSILGDMLGRRHVPVITTLEELDDAVNFVNEVLLAALEGSTPRHHPSSAAKRWWKPHLVHLQSLIRNRRRAYQRSLVTSARTEWLDAGRAFYRGHFAGKTGSLGDVLEGARAC